MICRKIKPFNILIITGCLISMQSKVLGQKNRDHDTSFYNSYTEKLTARTYLSRKYTNLELNPGAGIAIMKYEPNTTLNLGIGATYRSFTINIGVGLNSFNPNHEKGKTHYLDLQSHFYARQWNIDLLGEFYTGYFLSPKGLGSADGQHYYLRNDLSVKYGGIAAYRSLNDRQFSYQAGLLQNEWQKKSAGSVLVGGEAYYGSLHGDSSLAPEMIDADYKKKGINTVNFFEIGPGAGYAYTLVFKQHYFLLASATVNLDFRFSREKTKNANADRNDFTPNFIFRAGAGYNSRDWELCLLWVSDHVHVKGDASGYAYRVTTGNYRLIYAKRFSLNRKQKKALKSIEGLMPKNN